MNHGTSSNRILGKPNALAGFTLAETMIAAGISTVMFGAILGSSVALQESFKATSDYSVARGNQQLAIDYISRDLRGAYTVSLSADTQTLTMTMPSYYAAYDAQGNPMGNPVDPVITSGQPNYGNPAQPLTVSYFVNGGSLIRQQSWWTGGGQTTAQLVVATDVADFQSSFTDLTSIVTFSITFTPKYSEWNGTAEAKRDGTRISTSTSVRNTRRD